MTSYTELSGPLGKADIVERGWLHEGFPAIEYRWVRVNELVRNDEHGIEITHRYARSSDIICGARTIEPGIPGLDDYEGMDLSVPHEVVCALVGDHGEAPHIGVNIGCACDDWPSPGLCPQLGRYHMVIVGFAIRPGERATEQERTTS